MRQSAPARLLVLLLFVLCPALAVRDGFAQAPPATGPAGQQTPTPVAPTSATAIADKVMDALGGKAAWDATHYVCFTFASRRAHCWDKWTGRHRVEGKTQEGKTFVVLHNINTHEGTAYLDGQPVQGDAGKKMLDNAYALWVNDTYWLLMPYKLRDPGVNLSYAGTEQVDGKIYDKLELTFGNVGLTPGDHYWAYINRATGLMDRWAFVLQNQPKDAKPSEWRWEGWQKYDNIMLAPTRSQVGGDHKLELSNITVVDNLPDAVFTSPAPMATKS
jgi:hypothetical protein